MPNILILSEADDIHATAVDWGLRQFGLEPVLWKWSDFPHSDRYAVHLGPQQGERLTMTLGERHITQPFDVIWNRRPGKPRARAGSHPEDLKIISKEALAYLKNALDFVAHPDAMWVNPPDAIRRANHKLLQLVTAKTNGFAIPDTLSGNDIDQVRAFYDKHRGRIIFKAFLPGGWDEGAGNSRHLGTSALGPEHLKYDEAILACPGIFQEQIDTGYEIRVTIMGDKVLAGAIDSQASGPLVDWRFSNVLGQVPHQAMQLPEPVAQRCVAVCRALGIVFGCIDLIVTRGGEHVFIEVNEAGQFLWQEQAAPEIPMLDAFCRFLARGSVPPDVPPVTLADFYQSTSCPGTAPLAACAPS
ncbi:hypothetical protein ABT364_04725 [Massilia sp. SR12]